MPTPVSAARQCLTPDAARAVEEAVSVARRRAHSQTTSLHAVSALLALPSSLLRDACSRARSSAYSPRLQLRALELCFSVSLDRLPSSQTLDEPPISNSLMAAIKRSQANQRRNPDTYHQYQSFQPNQSQNSVLLIKVELRQLVLSVLDDPLVSRVFGEAGFRSTDIKLAIIRPPGPRFPRARFPPLFLCNFAQTHPDASDFDDNCRRMCEVLLQKKKKNLFLIGVSAREAVRNFRNCLEKGEMGPQFPREIAGLKFVCVEKDVAEGSVRSRCEELERSAAAAGVVVDVGDLKGFPDDGAAVAELSRVLELHHDSRLWLVGSAANYETYMKFLTRHPMVEKDWDLQLLPITSIRSGVGGLHPRPHSLMESFVPFGGFFPMLPDLKSPVSSTYQSPSRCRLCDENYEEELAAIVKGSSISVSDQQQASVPTCLQRGDLMSINCGWDLAKAKDDGSVLSTKVMVLQKKWNDICLRLHRSNQILEPDSYRMGPPLLPGVGFPFNADRKEILENQNGKSTNTSADQCERKNEFLMLKDSQKISQPYQSMSVPVVSELKNDDLLCKFNSRLAKTEELRKEGPQSPSVTSVTTDLMLGTNFAHVKEQKKDLLRNCKDRLKDVSGCFPVEDYSDSVVQNTYLMKGGLATRDQQCLDSSDATKRFDPRDFKSIWRALTEMVGRQEAAICAISQTIAHCKSANERRRGASLKGDIWLSFLGPDRMGKKKIAVALAELVSGSKEKLISVDLCSHDFGIPPNTIVNLGQEMSGYDAKFRGKTVIDYIAGEISRKPLAVVFLENVDKADLLLQDSLCQAVKTGKFRDSHGREIGVNNSIFVTTARWVRSKPAFNEKDTVNFSEERVSAAQGWQMQILIGRSSKRMTDISSNVLVTSLERPRDRKGSSSQVFVNKRKLEDFEQVHSSAKMCLDLNLSIEEMEENVIDSGDEETDSLSENSKAWLEEFLDLVDETVNFKTFDFDALADNILKKIRGIFQNSIGSEGSLEIDSKCMEHILAATWVSDGTKHVDDWIENVLRKCFIDARERCGNFFAPVLKLVTCEGSYMEEQAPGVCLPAGIILN